MIETISENIIKFILLKMFSVCLINYYEIGFIYKVVVVKHLIICLTTTTLYCVIGQAQQPSHPWIFGAKLSSGSG